MLISRQGFMGHPSMPCKKHLPPVFLVAMVSAFLCLPRLTVAQEVATPDQPKVVVENLLREGIVGAPDKEVIVSRVSFPPHTTLPWHWHPGEEIFYVIEGAVTLSRRGLPDTAASAGEVLKIAPKTIHTGQTAGEGAELVIFRVHVAGEPERYLVD
jgi:quercetin dioxygenase-like cupin family protein